MHLNANCKVTKIMATQQKNVKKTYFCKSNHHSMNRPKHQTIKKLASFIRRQALALLLLFAAMPFASAQYALGDGITFLTGSENQLAFEYNIFSISAQPHSNSFSVINTLAANSTNHTSGQPMLPVFRQIIELPKDGCFRIETATEKWDIRTLGQLGCSAPLAPAPPATIKSNETIAYEPDSTIYGTDAFWGETLVRIDTLGTMRTSRLAVLTISPVRYNPATGQVAVCSHFSATITFDKPLPPTHHNPMLNGTARHNAAKEYTNQLNANGIPQTFIVIAPLRFRQALQPWISWKRQTGYRIEEFYPDTATRETIKSHLQNRFDNATPNHPAPLFIMLVGDVQEIPVWPGTQRIPELDPHRTDLYYAEFTGDNLPDAILGRISASDTATLARIVEKSLSYELANLPDSSYLNRSLLVAGKEDTPPAPTATNGQINYLKNCIIQHDSLHDTICFYNPDSDTRRDSIMSILRQGIAFANYTAHCTSQGWRHPTLSNYDIDSLYFGDKPFFSINNCCRANEVSGDCFGEHLLRKSPGGAIGVIGASNETLWEEDYYWSVGSNGNPSLSPQHSPSMPGAYDRFFHLYNEPFAHHAPTQGQILLAGNWAVASSGSQYSNFYWEIYNLLGDPSLMPHIGIPATQHLEIDSITTGDVVISLHGTPLAQVAATANDSLLGICTIDQNGDGTMHILLPAPDSILFTATAQFHKPVQKTVRATTPAGARMTATSLTLTHTNGSSISQLTLCDSALATVTIHNAGLQTASGHSLTITTNETPIANIRTFTIASLQPQQDTAVSFILYPQQRTDQLTIWLDCADSSTYWSHQRSIDLLTANTTIKSLTLKHNSVTATTVKPTTDYELQVEIANNGNGQAKDLQINIANTGYTSLGNLDGNCSLTHTSQITTPAEIDSLILPVTITHRTDTLTRTFIFLADTTTPINVVNPAAENIAISPNPATNLVVFSGFNAPTRVVIHDLYGRIIKEFSAKNNETIQYSTDHLRCGIYSVLFVIGQPGDKPQLKTEKLIIAR